MTYSRYLFQASNIFLMGFQSFILPALVGFSSYGKAMLYLAPIYLYQSLLEPVFQGIYGSRVSTAGAGSQRRKLDLKILVLALLGLCISAFIVFLFFEGDIFIFTILLLVGFLYLYVANIQSFLLFEEQYFFVGISIFISVAFYFSAYFVVGLDFWFLLWGNLFYFGVLSLLLTIRLFCFRVGASFLADFGWRDFWGHMSTRAAYVFSSNGLVILFGIVGYSPEKVGIFRFSLSLMNAGRYFNPIPIVAIQKAISSFTSGREERALKNMLLRFVSFSTLYGVVLFIGWAIYNRLQKGSVEFNYIFLLVPIYLLIQPIGYFLAVKGYLGRQLFYFFLSALLAVSASFYSMWLSFACMLVAVFSMTLILVFRVKKI